MIYGIEENEMKKPEVLGARSVGMAVALHIVAFLLLYLFAMLHLKPRETVIPIDLTVVVNENLDGEENEPPPLDNPPPKVEQPKPTPPPAPPKVEEKIEAVEQIIEKKPEKPKEKPPEKPKEEKKPDPPKPEKTKEQLMQERMERMRNSAKEVKNPPKIIVKNQPSGNGKTDKQTLDPKQIEKLLNQGVKPGTKNQLAANEKDRCIRLIYMALESRWNQMSPKIGQEGTVQLGIRFDGAGRIVDCKLIKSCGDAISDKAAYSVVRSLSRVDGLGPEFLSVHSKEMVIINYKVRAK